MTTLFRNVLVYDETAPAGMTGPTDVLVVGDRITAVAPAQLPPDGARVIDGAGRHLVLPGLINAHFHSPANHLRGSVPSQPLETFMLAESPADPALAPTPREAYLRTMLGAIEMLPRGMTTVQDDAFLMPTPDPEIIDAVAAAYRDSGIRAWLALDQPELAEAQKLPFVDEITDPAIRSTFDAPAPAPASELLAAYDHLIGTWHGAADDRIRAAVSVSAPQRVGLGYFAALDDLARRHDIPLYVHMLETKVQRTLMTEQARFGGRSVVGWTADAGLLGPQTNVIHAVWVDHVDMATLAHSGATVVHNPVSNLRLGSGVMPWRAMLDHGVPVALGTDEAICDDTINVWTVAKLAGLLHNVAGRGMDEWPTAREVLDALWSGGARAVRRSGELGVVAPGALADLALVDLHGIAFTPLNDLRQQLVYGQDGRDVVLTMVAGTVVAEHGRLSLVDQDALLDEARDTFARRQPALAAARAESGKLLPAYRHIADRAAATDVGFSRWLVPAPGDASPAPVVPHAFRKDTP